MKWFLLVGLLGATACGDDGAESTGPDTSDQALQGSSVWQQSIDTCINGAGDQIECSGRTYTTVIHFDVPEVPGCEVVISDLQISGMPQLVPILSATQLDGLDYQVDPKTYEVFELPRLSFEGQYIKVFGRHGVGDLKLGFAFAGDWFGDDPWPTESWIGLYTATASYECE